MRRINMLPAAIKGIKCREAERTRKMQKRKEECGLLAEVEITVTDRR
jgi:hypothetical protein